MTKTLNDLATSVDFYDHVALDEPIPILSGMQAQGDVLALPVDLTQRASVTVRDNARWYEVPAGGVTLVEGQHPHVLTADAGTCRYTLDVTDAAGLAVAVLTATEPVWLLHPEHGGAGLAAGSYVIRRQREQAQEARIVAD